MPSDTNPKSGAAPAVFILLLLAGMYFPSVASERFSAFSLSAFVIVAALLLLLVFRKHGHPNFLRCLAILSITPLLLLFTVTSGLATLKLGALFQYAVLSVMLIATFRDIILPRWDVPRPSRRKPRRGWRCRVPRVLRVRPGPIDAR